MGAGPLPGAIRFRQEGQEQVTFLELFFDLVFVFAITQLWGRLIDNLSVVGPRRCCSSSCCSSGATR